MWVLGWVSLCMDLSSEIVHSLLPLLLVHSLGASMLVVGLIEGIAESSALIVKVFSGALSDRLGRRKGLLLLGYGMAALTRPLFPLAQSAAMVFTARFLDRIGKGIRGAPRDALLADVSPPAIRGACYGLRQSMDTIGAILGPVAAIALMVAYADDIAAVLWWSVLPASAAFLLIVFFVKEHGPAPAQPQSRAAVRWDALRDLPRAFWWVVAVGAVFTLARFSEAFLVLRAREVGLALAWVPLVMVVMSITYAATAYPAGKLSDRIDRAWLLAAGLVLLVFADGVLALAASPAAVLAGAALWGLHMGFTQGILATLVADTAPADLKGTAFGVFSLASGIALLVASVLAGALWQAHGSATTFYAGAAFSVAALLLLAAFRYARPRISQGSIDQ